MARNGTIRVGIGGWTFEPWRGVFYPRGLPHKEELQHASRQVTSIEINGTYYGSQKPESFARWRDETPEDFVFSVKGPRFATNRRQLAEAAASIERFFASGVMQLKEKLGPVNWQFLPTKRFDASDFEEFLKLLPKQVEGREVRHVVEVRHESFGTADFVALLRSYGVAVAITDKTGVPQFADVTAPFVYLRLQRASRAAATGYPPPALDAWTARVRRWASGRSPADLEPITAPAKRTQPARDVFVYMINGFKPRAPAAAMALLKRLAGPSTPIA